MTEEVLETTLEVVEELSTPLKFAQVIVATAVGFGAKVAAEKLFVKGVKVWANRH